MPDRCQQRGGRALKGRRVRLYCATGTGNSLLAARRLARRLEHHGLMCGVEWLADAPVPALGENEALGLVFPVAAQSTYPFVWDFVDALPPGNGAPVFAVDTLHSFSGGLLGPLKRRLVTKGYHPIGAKELKMPCNLTVTTPDAQANEAVVATAMNQADAFADQLVHGLSVWPKGPMGEPLFHTLSRARATWALTRFLFRLHVNSDACVHCGLCVKLCPTQAVQAGEPPQIGPTCQLCLRCFACCPKRAIRSRMPLRPYRAAAPAEFLRQPTANPAEPADR